MHKEVMRIIAMPESKEKLANFGADAGTLNREGFGGFIKTESAKFGDVEKKSGMKID